MAKTKCSTASYTVEYGLCFNDANPTCVLDKLEKIAISIYNDVLGEGLKRLHKVQHDPAYKTAFKEYRKLMEKKKDDLSEEEKEIRKQLLDIMNKACEQYRFTEYDLHEYVKAAKHHFHDQLGINECQKLATRAYKSLVKLRNGVASKVNFKSRYRDLISIENKSNVTGIRFDRESLCVVYKKHRFPIRIKRNDQYAMQALQDKVKYVRLVPKKIKGKVKWYAQLVFEGIPPKKDNHVYGSDDMTTGLDIGVSTVAVVNENTAQLTELAPECKADERKIRILSRKMDRSRRATNPENYNADGTVKKGRLTWNKSKSCQKTASKLSSLHRKARVKRKQSHETLANQIIAMSTDIRVEQMSFRGLQKRSKKTTQKKSGKNNSKKRYGKTIENRAPVALLSIIDRKLSYVGRKLKKIDTYRVKASQYNPLTGNNQKKELKDRMIELAPGVIVQRDMLSAYVISHTDKSLKKIRKRECRDNFERYKELQDRQIEQMKKENQLRWYIS